MAKKIRNQVFRLDVEDYNAWYTAQPIHNTVTYAPDETLVVGEYRVVCQGGLKGIYAHGFSFPICGEIPLRFLTRIE